MRRRAIYILAAAVLFPIFEKAGVECALHGFGTAAWWLMSAADILQLVLFALLLGPLLAVSRQSMKKRAICVLVVALLFPVLQKAGIECDQHGLAVAGSCLTSAANILKPIFLILLVAFLVLASRLHPNSAVQAFVALLSGALFFLSCGTTVLSGRIILNLSRPAWPGTFTRDQAAVRELTDLAHEMIQGARVFWIGNEPFQFLFAVHYPDADYRFASSRIAEGGDLGHPVDAEDTSKVAQAIFRPLFRPTDKALLGPNDYEFCKRASKTIRRIGFDSVQLHREQNIVQYEIDDFLGHHGMRYIYCFSPESKPPEGFQWEQLSVNWYFVRKPGFSDS